MKLLHWCAAGLTLCFARGAGAQRTATSSRDSVAEAVQHFYDWYVPRAAKPGRRDMIMEAATHGPLQFDTTLVRWLRVDSTARARAVGEIDGLDSDPYLNAQDPCDTYRVGTATVTGPNARVSVVGHGGCAAHRTADVVVELKQSSGEWVVYDFLDPHFHNQGLRATLKELHPSAG